MDCTHGFLHWAVNKNLAEIHHVPSFSHPTIRSCFLADLRCICSVPLMDRPLESMLLEDEGGYGRARYVPMNSSDDGAACHALA